MSRIKLLTQAEMTDAQRSVHDAIVTGRRGRAPAPLLAWLTSPELASRAQKLGELVRYETTLPPRLAELAILAVAHFWNARYEWVVHEQEARKVGLDGQIIDDIARGRPPRFRADAERVVYDLVLTLQETHEVSDTVYAAAIEALGERAIVELVGLVGYYTLIAMTLKAFEIGAPEGFPSGSTP